MIERAIAFLGPSRPSVVPTGITLRPPAAAGDLLACVAGQCRTIVLVDGVFDARAAVWHKEILLLLALSFRVIGAASMGALRAAELHSQGMEGVGRVFEAYRTGRLVADDEVALLHMPERLGSAAITEPLVNVRATLGRGVRSGELPREDAEQLMAAARALHFSERDIPGIFRLAALDRPDIARLQPWFERARVDVKAQDAAHALNRALAPAPLRRACPLPPRTVFFEALAAARGITLQDWPLSGKTEPDAFE